jgi:hypothetical protein
MNRFIKSSLLVGALLSTIGATVTAPAQFGCADVRQ